jgi:DNA polymerase sigma
MIPQASDRKPMGGTVLVIQGPNDASNIISHSSFMIHKVFECFSKAYDTLTEYCAYLRKLTLSNGKEDAL